MPKGTGNIIREPPDKTGNRPALGIHIGSPGLDIKNIKMTNTSFVMNLLIIYQVHHLSTKNGWQTPTEMPKSTLKILNKLFL